MGCAAFTPIANPQAFESLPNANDHIERDFVGIVMKVLNFEF